MIFGSSGSTQVDAPPTCVLYENWSLQLPTLMLVFWVAILITGCNSTGTTCGSNNDCPSQQRCVVEDGSSRCVAVDLDGGEDAQGDASDARSADVEGETGLTDAADTQTCGSGEARCGGECVDLSVNPDHCGNCGMTCGGETEICADGTCVQCREDSDCGDDAACDGGQCTCQQPRCGDAECGTVSNSCGNTVSCGTCGSDQVCEDLRCVCSEVYAYTVGRERFGSAGTVRKVDRSGNEVWSYAVDAPSAIAVDDGGFVYVASSDGPVRKLRPDGSEAWTFEGHGESSVRDVAVDTAGRSYTASEDGTVRQLDADGDQIWSFTEPSGIQRTMDAVAVAESGYAYSGSNSASLSDPVRKLDSQGAQIWEVDAFEVIKALAVSPAGSIYVAGKQTLYKLDTDGNELWSWRPVADRGGMSAVAVDSDGFVYAASYNVSRDGTVHKLDADGNEIWEFPGHENTISELAVDSTGHVYSASRDGTMRKLTPDGREMWSFSGDEWVVGVAVDPGSAGAGFESDCGN